MGWFKYLFGMSRSNELQELPYAIERAVTNVEPLLRQSGGYPRRYRKSVKIALKYARKLALNVPGPVQINNVSYAMDAFVHAIFPSVDFVTQALCSSSEIMEYRQKHPECHEIYALMGMRRKRKSTMGMELSGEVMQQDVPQKMIYFTSHTLESPAATEQQARDLIVWSFFDKLVSEVVNRIQALKQEKQSQLMEIDLQKARLHAANAETRLRLQADFSEMLRKVQVTSKALDLKNYYKHFEAILQQPEKYLRLRQVELVLDSMGVLQKYQSPVTIKPVVFNDLIGFDKREWTVILVHCNDMKGKTFAARLEDAYRRLSI